MHNKASFRGQTLTWSVIVDCTAPPSLLVYLVRIGGPMWMEV